MTCVDRFAPGHGVRLHYLYWPSPASRAVVLLHGLRGAHSWDDVSAALADLAEVFALDQHGRGETNWASDGDSTLDAYLADLDALVGHLGRDRVILVGHSMGGIHATCWAARHPARMAGLVVVDAGPESDPAGNARSAAEIRNGPEEFASFEAALAAAREANPRVPAAVLRRRVEWETRQLGNGRVGWRDDKVISDQRRTGTVPPRPGLWPFFEAVKCPTLVLRGALSDALPATVAARMRDVMPHGRLVTIFGAGHMVFEEQAEATIRALRAFITENPSC